MPPPPSTAGILPAAKKDYSRYVKKKWTALFVFAGILAAVFLLSVSLGAAMLPLGEVVSTLGGGGTAQSRAIIWNLRMPRIATGISVGVALSIAGCVMQNVMRNPLASASTLGVLQGASFGAALAIVNFGAGVQIGSGAAAAISITNPPLVVIFAFLGGIASTAVILALSRAGNFSPSAMILAGVALGAMFTGATALIQYFADDIVVATVVYWTFGNLGRAGWNEVALIFLFAALALAFFIFNAWNYNAIESGTNTAKSLGVPVDHLIVGSMIAASFISSVAVAFVGTINFIGLIAPHIARRFVGGDYRFLIPASAITGAALMLSADLVSRMIVSPIILPIGAVTSFLGAPLFLYLIVRKKEYPLA
ncbi:MAG: iron ABC transporter permease [Spirochaetes bacterium]|nr:iron ABC transporter permease [Spirochaetota bacterium]